MRGRIIPKMVTRRVAKEVMMIRTRGRVRDLCLIAPVVGLLGEKTD